MSTSLDYVFKKTELEQTVKFCLGDFDTVELLKIVEAEKEKAESIYLPAH